MAAQPAAIDRLDELRRSWDRSGFQQLTESGHEFILRLTQFFVLLTSLRRCGGQENLTNNS
jgi:hypothetical protein